MDTDCEMIEMEIRRPAICCICGDECENSWGVPINPETALICHSDCPGKRGAKPVCEQCHTKHAEGQFVGHDPEF